MKSALVLWQVIKLNWRSRFLSLFLLFACSLHYLALRLMRQATFSFQGVVTEVGPNQAMFVSLYLSFFIICFVAITSAIWLVPQLHRGDKALLTFVWPVPKSSFLFVYGVQLFLFIFMEWVVLFSVFIAFYGAEGLRASQVSWSSLIQYFTLVVISLQAMHFLLASSSLVWGPLATLFITAISYISLQVWATLNRLGFVSKTLITQLLPPVGNLIFDLKEILSGDAWKEDQLLIWLAWTLIGGIWFRKAISRR